MGTAKLHCSAEYGDSLLAGGAYHGLQIHENIPTVEGELSRALAEVGVISESTLLLS